MIINEDTQRTLTTVPSAKRTTLSLQFRFSERFAILVIVDALIMAMAAWWAIGIWDRFPNLAKNRVPFDNNWQLYVALIIGWLILAWFNDLYDIPSSTKKTLNAMRGTVASVLGLILYLVAFALIPNLPPRLLFIIALLLAQPGLALWRFTYAVAFDRPPFIHRVLILGGGRAGQAIAILLRQAAGVKSNVVGYVDNDPAISGDMPQEIPFLGREHDLPRLVREFGIHEIVVATERDLEPNLFQLLIECQTQGVPVSWMPNLYEKLYRQVPIEYIDTGWALQALQGRPIFSRIQQYIKRLLDVLLIAIGLPVVLLVFLPLAVAIRLDSSGPVFYRQTRTGRGGKLFPIFKFRTMFVDAEKNGIAQWATKDDPRITRVGHLLRKSRMDELPQLINVIKGEMSLIGPRPERPEFVEELQQEIPFYRTRLMVKPGLTGWAQIHYDYGNTVADALAKLNYDFYYIRYWSLWLDLYILFRTAGVVFKLKGI